MSREALLATIRNGGYGKSAGGTWWARSGQLSTRRIAQLEAAVADGSAALSEANEVTWLGPVRLLVPTAQPA